MRCFVFVVSVCCLLNGCWFSMKNYGPRPMPTSAEVRAQAPMSQPVQEGKVNLWPFYTSKPTETGGRIRRILGPVASFDHSPDFTGRQVLTFMYVSHRLPDGSANTRTMLFPLFFSFQSQKMPSVSEQPKSYLHGVWPLFMFSGVAADQSHERSILSLDPNGKLALFRIHSDPEKRNLKIGPLPTIPLP